MRLLQTAQFSVNGNRYHAQRRGDATIVLHLCDGAGHQIAIHAPQHVQLWDETTRTWRTLLEFAMRALFNVTP